MLYEKTPCFSAALFNSFLQRLLSITQNNALQGYSFSLYWLDIVDIPIAPNGNRQFAKILAPVKDEKGVCILFKKGILDVLYVGYTGSGNSPASVFYTTVKNNQGGSGRVEHLLKPNGINNQGIVNYFNTNIANTGKSWDNFMNEYSILFICVTSDDNSSINNVLSVLTKELKIMLNPLANS